MKTSTTPKEICWGPTIYYSKQTNKLNQLGKLKQLTLQEKHIVHEAINI
jgi:hypothetical protein